MTSMHYKHHDKACARVLIAYRDFKDYDCDYDEQDTSSSGKSHRGLGINALMTARVLRKHGIQCDLAPVADLDGLRAALTKLPQPPTHVIIEAVWINSSDTALLCSEFPTAHFIVRLHSQIGFLQVEPSSIATLRDLLSAQEMLLNLTVASNTRRLTEFLETTYASKVLYLPNLYDIERVWSKRDECYNHKLLRIGSFGAHRVLKNHTTAAAAALMIAHQRSCDLEFHVNSGRAENEHKNAVLQSLRAMFSGLSWAKLVEVPWADWSKFRHEVAHMDLNLQPSFTETFNIVTADAVCEGVSSVVSDAIEWAPREWVAQVDDAASIARIGTVLLWDNRAAERGLHSLQRHMRAATNQWLGYLDQNPTL